VTTDNRITPGLIYDITNALERHGYYRSDDQHADRAIGLIGDMARTYEGTQHHPFGPYLKEPPLRTEPAPPRPAAQDIVVLSASEVRTVISAIGEASVYKRNRVGWAATAPTSPAAAASGASRPPGPTTSWQPSWTTLRRPGDPQPRTILRPPASFSP